MNVFQHFYSMFNKGKHYNDYVSSLVSGTRHSESSHVLVSSLHVYTSVCELLLVLPSVYNTSMRKFIQSILHALCSGQTGYYVYNDCLWIKRGNIKVCIYLKHFTQGLNGLSEG